MLSKLCNVPGEVCVMKSLSLEDLPRKEGQAQGQTTAEPHSVLGASQDGPCGGQPQGVGGTIWGSYRVLLSEREEVRLREKEAAMESQGEETQGHGGGSMRLLWLEGFAATGSLFVLSCPRCLFTLQMNLCRLHRRPEPDGTSS